MLTKEQLLQKGLSEAEADELLADKSPDTGDSLEDLQKALESPEDDEQENMSKAEKPEKEDKGEEDEDEEEYDEKFMKKMKKYMKANPGCMGGKMKKAVEEIDEDAAGGVVEMADLAPVLNAISEEFADMTKAISDLKSEIKEVSAKSNSSYDLMQKAARVTADQAKDLNIFLNGSQGRKSVVATQSMTKATEIPITKQDNQLVWAGLEKAVKSGNKDAGILISAFESHGHDVRKLNPAQRKRIYEIINKEDK